MLSVKNNGGRGGITVEEFNEGLNSLRADMVESDTVIEFPEVAEVPEYVETIARVEAKLDTLNEGGLQLKDEVIKQNVDDYLREHPEVAVKEDSVGLNMLKPEVRNIFSDVWNESTTYEVNDYVIFNNSLWRCLIQNTSEQPIEGEYWTKTSISSEFSSTKQELEVEVKDIEYNGATIRFFRYGKIVSFMSLSVISGVTNNKVIGTAPFAPLHYYNITAYRTSVAPYKEVGSLWISAADRKMTIYTSDTGGLGYIQGIYICHKI